MPFGRGMDWMTPTVREKDNSIVFPLDAKGEKQGSSQIVYSFAAKIGVDRSSSVYDVSK